MICDFVVRAGGFDLDGGICHGTGAVVAAAVSGQLGGRGFSVLRGKHFQSSARGALRLTNGPHSEQGLGQRYDSSKYLIYQVN